MKSETNVQPQIQTIGERETEYHWLKSSVVLFLVALILRSASLILATRVLRVTILQVASFQDGPSYLSLASQWPIYAEAHSVIHFPFYPLVIAFFSLFTSSPQLAGVVVSILAGSLAVPVYGQVLQRYTERWLEIALIFSVFPFRWFNINQLVMSEALFLFLLLLSLLLHEKGHYVLSGFVLGLSSLTKLSGILLLPVFLVRSLRSRDLALRAGEPMHPRVPRVVREILLWFIPFLVPLVVLGLYFAVRFGNAGVYFQEHNRLWGGSYFSYPFSSYVSGFVDPGITWFRKPYVALVLILYFGGFIVGVMRWRRSRSEWVLWLSWALPFILLQTVLRGGAINWGFISSARLLMPASPAILLFWMGGCSRKRLLILFGLLVPLAFAYTLAEFSVQ